MFTRIALAAAFALSAAAASADSISLEAPMQAASLHTGGVDMVVYYLDETDHFQIVATYAPKADAANPSRVVMGLTDGDEVSFSMPGETQVAYTFARDGETVTVDADLTGIKVTEFVD